MPTEISLIRVDQSGVFALPDGIQYSQIAWVLIDGAPTQHVFVKNNTEIDIPLARPESVVTAILREE